MVKERKQGKHVGTYNVSFRRRFFKIQIKFKAIIGSQSAYHIAIDDINTLNYDCSIPGACTFEKSLCSWTNQENDDTNWAIRDNFIYLNTKYELENNTARLMSMELDPTTARCASFQYFLFLVGMKLSLATV